MHRRYARQTEKNAPEPDKLPYLLIFSCWAQDCKSLSQVIWIESDIFTGFTTRKACRNCLKALWLTVPVPAEGQWRGGEGCYHQSQQD